MAVISKEAVEEAKRALNSLASWRIKCLLKTKQDSCSCNNTTKCIWHRAIKAAESKTIGSHWLLKLCRDTAIAAEKELGICSCKECLLCLLRSSLTKLSSQSKNKKPPVPRFLGRLIIGNYCKNGHLITEDNLGTRQDPRKKSGKSSVCKDCKRANDRKHNPRKRVDGYCIYGLHKLEGDNLKINPDGSRSCKTCRRLYEMERARRKNPDYKPVSPTHCRNGHEKTVENQVVYKDGQTRCKVCRDHTKTRIPKLKNEYCQSGRHELTPENIMQSSNRNFCRLCHNDSVNEYRRKQVDLRLQKRIIEVLREAPLKLQEIVQRIKIRGRKKEQHQATVERLIDGLVLLGEILLLPDQNKFQISSAALSGSNPRLI